MPNAPSPAGPALPALIIAQPGALRDAWRALLMTIPRLGDIEQAADAGAALQAVARRRPGLVVVEARWPHGEVTRLLSQIKAISPETRRVVMVETVQQRRALAATAAEAVMLQGAPAAVVAAALERLLAGPADPSQELS